MRIVNAQASAPTAQPWTWSSAIGETYILGARSMKYHGWPTFGQPVVCEVKYTVSVEEGEANKRLIVEACNACHAVNPGNPLAAALAYQHIITACHNVLALQMSDTRHDPVVAAVMRIVRTALDAARRKP